MGYWYFILVLLPHFFTKKATLKFIKPIGDFKIILTALKNAVSEFINESSAGITVMIFNFMMIKYLGSDGVAAYTIMTYFIMISIMISFAVSDGLQPIVSRHYGTTKALKDIVSFEDEYFSKLNEKEQTTFQKLIYKIMN